MAKTVDDREPESLASPPKEDVSPEAPINTDSRITRQLLAIASVVVLGSIMSILDVTVVNVALPALTAEFGTTLTTIQWIATGYTLALATVIPITGWGADRFGTKRIYLISLLLFTAGSALAATAWSVESLILFRVLQGLGGGMLMPAGMTILTRAAGPQRIGRVMAIIGVPMLLGPILGPILGGYLIDQYAWYWIFLINVPIGIFALILTMYVLPKDVPHPSQKLDVIGLFLLSPGLALVIYGLAKAAQENSFTKTSIMAPSIFGVVLIVIFVVRSLRIEQPLIDLRLFANRVFSLSSLTLFMVALSVFGGMLLIPLYLIQVRGESAFQTGLLMAPQGLGAMLAMPIAGYLTDRTGVGKIIPLGLATVQVSFLGLTRLESDTSYVTLGIWLFVMGLGMGFAMMPTFSGAMQTLPEDKVARASTSLNIVQQVGASVGTAVMTILFTTILDDKTSPDHKSFLAAMQEAAQAGKPVNGPLPPELVSFVEEIKTLSSQAYAETYIWAGLLVGLALFGSLFLPMKRAETKNEGVMLH